MNKDLIDKECRFLLSKYTTELASKIDKVDQMNQFPVISKIELEAALSRMTELVSRLSR